MAQEATPIPSVAEAGRVAWVDRGIPSDLMLRPTDACEFTAHISTAVWSGGKIQDNGPVELIHDESFIFARLSMRRQIEL